MKLAALFGAALPVNRRAELHLIAAREHAENNKTLDKIRMITDMDDRTADAELDAARKAVGANIEQAGSSFRAALVALTERQEAEIKRLRELVRQISAERPRKLIAITSVRRRWQSGDTTEKLFGLDNEGCAWSFIDGAWEREASLPQAADEMVQDGDGR